MQKRITKVSWSEQDIEKLKSMWETASVDELISAFPNRTRIAIERFANKQEWGKSRWQKKLWKPEEEELIKSLWNKDKDGELKAALPNRTWGTICNKASVLGLRTGKERDDAWTEQEIADLRANWGQKHISEIELIIPNRTRSSLTSMASKLDLKANASISHQIYDRDENFFDIPNIINSYYAGWIASDGSIKKSSENKMAIEISLQIGDVEVLESLKKHTKYTGDIKYIKNIQDKQFKNCPLPSKIQDQCKLSVHCKQWVMKLYEHWNITPNKSLTYIGPHSHGYENDLAFVLGYIEGDGYISTRIINGKLIPYFGVCSSSKQSLIFIRDFLNENFFKEDKINVNYNRTTNNYHISVSHFKCVPFLRALFNLKTPHLSRKWTPELLSFLSDNGDKLNEDLPSQ